MKSFNYYWRYLLQIFYSFLRKNCTKQKALLVIPLTLEPIYARIYIWSYLSSLHFEGAKTARYRP